MVNLCVICTSRDSLKPLSDDHRGVLETLVSTAVNLWELRHIKLLVCSACMSLIKSLAQFRNRAIDGVKHLLLLSQNKLIEPEEVYIKGEPSNKGNSVVTCLENELELECGKKLQDGMKAEWAQAINCDNIQDVTPKSTIQVTDTYMGEKEKAQDSRQTPLISQSANTAVFTHSKMIQSNGIPQNQTANIAAHPRIKLVPQNQLISAHCPPVRFFNPPQFLPNPYYSLHMPTYLPPIQPVNVMPPFQNMAPNMMEMINLEPSSNDFNNPQPSAGEPAQMQPINVVMPPRQNMARKGKAPKPVAPKLMEERNPEARSDYNNPLSSAGKVIIKPRWFTQVVSHHQMLMQRARERARPEFADAPYKCKTCILLFGSQEEMEAHVKEHDFASDQLPCHACALPVRTSDEDAHETRHTTRHQCARCTFSTEHLNVIEAHDCSSQPVKTRKKKKRKYDKPFKCVLCGIKYGDQARLDRHNERAHKNPEVYKCDVCNKEYSRKSSLYMHNWNKHKAKDNDIDALRPELFCAECNLSFTTASQYRQHRMSRKHCPEDSYNCKFECDLCKKKFFTKGQVGNHIQGVHAVEKHVVCKECGKSLPNQFRLHRHMLAHDQRRKRPRPHVCHICGKAFFIRKSLEEHVFSHSGLRPHKCPLCPATFTYSAALFTHNRLKHLKIKRNRKKTKKDKS